MTSELVSYLEVYIHSYVGGSMYQKNKNKKNSIMIINNDSWIGL